MTKQTSHTNRIAGILSILGATVSIVGLVFATSTSFKAESELVVAFVAILISLLAGIYSKYVINILRKLRRSKRVFLSYPYGVKPVVHEVANALRGQGAKVWIDTEQLRPGEPFAETIDRALDDTDAFVIFIAKEISPYASKELERAIAKGIKIVPVLLESGDIPKPIQELKFVDMRKDKKLGIDEIIEATA